LQDRYGGGRQGGIAPSRESPNVLIFTDPRAGNPHGYIYDGFDPVDPTLFRHTGEGQQGDQRMVAGNRMILQHADDGRALRVFKRERGLVRYMGEFKLDRDPYEVRRAPPSGGGPDRDVIVFRLRPVTAATESPPGRPRDASYRRAEPNPVQGSEQPFYRDPNQLDRALKADADVQNKLKDFLAANGARPWSPTPGEPDFDLAWIRAEVTFVAGVKSLAEGNEDRQLRLGLGQVLDYQELMATRSPGTRAVLAVERQPRDPRWVRLCERHHGQSGGARLPSAPRLVPRLLSLPPLERPYPGCTTRAVATCGMRSGTRLQRPQELLVAMRLVIPTMGLLAASFQSSARASDSATPPGPTSPIGRTTATRTAT
jgi:hypothetical protein